MLDGAGENAAMQNLLKTHFAFFVGKFEAVAAAATRQRESTALQNISTFAFICVYGCGCARIVCRSSLASALCASVSFHPKKGRKEIRRVNMCALCLAAVASIREHKNT